MRRPGFLITVVTVGVVVGFVAGPVAAEPERAGSAHPASSAGTSAVAYQEDAAHDGQSNDSSFVGPLNTLWSADLGGEVFYPLIVGDRVFVDARNGSGSGTSVEARSLATGDVEWGPVNIGGLYGFGGIAYDGGRLFALNYSGTLWAFNASTGAQEWSVHLPGQSSFTSSPTAAGGTVYASGAGSGGTVYAVAEATGQVSWTQSVENGDSSSPAVDSSGVYASYACEQAYSFTTGGALRWHHSTGCEGGGGRTDVLHAGRVYIRDDATMSPAALSETDGSQVGAFTSDTAPAFDGTTMVTLANGTLTATDLGSGTTIWQNAAKTWTVAPLIVNGYVVAGASDGAVELLDEQTGATDWQGSAGTTITSPDEHNAVGVVGLAEAEGALAVPAGNHLTLYSGSATPHARFTAGPAEGSTVRSNATFSFDSNDAGASYQCTLDSATVDCTSPYTVTGLTDGHHTFSVAVAGYPSSAADRHFVADRRAPQVALGQLRPRFATSPSIRASWRATDSESGVGAYDVRSRQISNAGRAARWHQISRLTNVSRTRANVGVPQHVTRCLSVRARDQVGNASAWSAPQCVTGLTDDRMLSASRGWFRGTAASDFDRTFTGTSRHGATLRLRRVHADRLAVSAVVCPTCGSIKVSFGKTSKTFSLQSTLTGTRRFVLPPLRHTIKRTLVVRVTSRRGQVEIDGVGVAPR